MKTAVRQILFLLLVLGAALPQACLSRRAAAPPPPPPHRIGADVAQANLSSKVAPAYPELARAARVQDYVALQATIDKEGNIVDLKILHGHPLLNDAAIEAVKRWRYRPMLLNGQPIEVVTTITVNFSFQE